MGYFVAASLPISAIDAAFPSGNSTGIDEMLRDARVDLLAGRNLQAEDKLRQVIAARPSSAEAQRFLGRARARQGDPSRGPYHAGSVHAKDQKRVFPTATDLPP